MFFFSPCATEEPAQAVPTQTYDVVIAATPTDAELVSFIKSKHPPFGVTTSLLTLILPLQQNAFV